MIAIHEQIPFFCCPNVLWNEKNQRDIEKYIYCNETGTKPYKGAYGDTLKKWIDKFFIIKNALAKRSNYIQANHKKKINKNG